MSREKPKKSSKIPKNAAPLHYNIYNIAENFSSNSVHIGAVRGDFLIFPQYLVVNITTIHKREKFLKKFKKNAKNPCNSRVIVVLYPGMMCRYALM